MAAVKPTNWMMKGQVVISCNCDYGCPCNVNGRPTSGKCEGGWTWHVEQGSYGDLRLDGLNIGLYANWPAAIHEGNGIATCLVDERADEPQRTALRGLLEGSGGGPWAIFRKTFSELHGPRYVRYDVDLRPAAVQDLLGDEAKTIEIENLSAMDAPENMDALHRLGIVAGQRKVQRDHFPARFNLT